VIGTGLEIGTGLVMRIGFVMVTAVRHLFAEIAIKKEKATEEEGEEEGEDRLGYAE
jgi:hypothetical protein